MYILPYRDVVFIGPSANQIRASDVEAEDVFELTLDQGLTNSGDGPGQIKVHDMAQVHLDMYKGKQCFKVPSEYATSLLQPGPHPKKILCCTIF